MSRPAWRELAINLGVAAVSLGVALGLAEAAARLAGAEPERGVNPLFTWTGKEGEFWRFEAGARWLTRVGGHPVAINSAGFRDVESGPKANDAYRIAVLGDSVTFGHGQPVALRFSDQLEQLLSGRSPRVEVLNRGIPGWSSYQQRAYYEREGEGLEADLVLVGFVLNDVTEIHRGLIELRLATGMRIVRFLNALAERSAAVAALKRGYVDVAAPQDRQLRGVLDLVLRQDAPEVQRAMESTLAELGRIEALARERGERFGLVLFPFRFQLEDPRLDAPQRRLMEFAAARGIPVLDTAEPLRTHGADAVLMDADHFTPLGHRVVAEALAGWLEAEGLLPPDSSARGEG